MLAMSSRYGLRPASRSVSRKIGSWVRGVHEATTTRFSRYSAICCLDAVLAVVGAGVDVVFGKHHVGQMRPLRARRRSTSTTEAMLLPQWQTNTPTRGGSSADVALGRIGLGADAASAGRGQERHRPGRRRAGLHHRVGNVLGLLERPAHEHARPRGVHAEPTRSSGRIPSGSAPRPSARPAPGGWRWAPGPARARPCRTPLRPASSPGWHRPAGGSACRAFRTSGK